MTDARPPYEGSESVAGSASATGAATADWVAVALEEYRTLRQESLQAIDRQHQILVLGTGGSGVLLGLGANQSAGSTVATVLLVVIVPAIVYLAATVWLGEFERMVRAGAHLAELESRIAERYAPAPPPLTWETTLRSGQLGRARIAGVYRAIFVTFLTLALAAVAAGLLGLASEDRWWSAGALFGLNLLGLVLAIRHYVATELGLRIIGGEDPRAGAAWRLAMLLRCRPVDENHPA